MKQKGKVYLVGAGPGDAGLITVKALECLRHADVIVYDRLVNPRLLEYALPGTECIYAGKSPVKHTLSQDEINTLLVKKAKTGKIVVRLKCGDPFLFGRGAEEALVLVKQRISFEVVPGVTSAFGASAYAGIPLTHREYTSSVGIFTGHEEANKKDSGISWDKIATGLGTLVFLMGVEHLSEIVKNLISFGRPSSSACCLIQQGTLPLQRSVCATLATIVKKAKQEKIAPPAIFVVGNVVSLRKRLNWFESMPLFGKNILITRPHDDRENKFSKLLEDYGAQPVALPVVEIKPLKEYSRLDSTLRHIDNFQWVIFTSHNGVMFFKERLACLKKDVRILKEIHIASIGPKTQAALEAIGIRADMASRQFCQEGLLECFKKINLKDKHILIVRARKARDVLPQGLKAFGASVTIAPAYRTSAIRYPQSTLPDLKDIDIITFTSSSCVEGFFGIFSKKTILNKANKFKTASIGPVTSATARRLGLRVDIEATQYTFDGLSEAIVKYYND